MAQHRQSGAERIRSQHDLHPATADSGDQIIIRIPHTLRHHHRTRRTGKGLRRFPAGAIALALALALALLAARRLSRHPLVLQIRSYGKTSESDQETHQSLLLKELKFGHGAGIIGGRDSRYWYRDDRRRDQDYNEEDTSEHSDDSGDRNPEDVDRAQHKLVQAEEGYSGGSGLYNEDGRAELDTYKEEYQESLKNDMQSTGDNGFRGQYDEDDAGINDVTGELDSRYLVVTKKDAGSGKMDRSYPVPSSEKKSSSKRKPKYHKFSGSYCEMKFLNSTAQLVEPLENKKFSRFSLQYKDVEERPSGAENWEPRFAGHQKLQEREESFHVRDQRINCGFIKSAEGSPSTGFDLAEDDVKFMSSCHIVVSSCIFGNPDHLRSPFSKKITRGSRKNVCFVMFLDENTLQTLLLEGQKMDGGGFIGLWKIVVVRNLPYADMRRVGKIPKFLSHRLFPSARYSIWMDSKLRLQSDPYLILEYFLWRRGYEYAISNHYDRHCVWEEVMQNKQLNKFNHTIIDQQFQFYQSDGLKRFNPSDPNKLLPSYVPEGSFIVRAHTPMSNLFSCLWFNEVDRFTPRDQLSFSYTYLKLRRMNPGKPFHLNMFKDCERRSVAKLFHHRAEEKQNIPIQEIG